MKRALLTFVCVVASCGPAPVRRGPAASGGDVSADGLDAQGEAFLRRGEFDRAEAAFARALAIEPGLAIAHHGLGVLRFHRADTAGALAAFEAGIARTAPVDPSYMRTQLLEAVAWVHALEGRTEDALRTIEASVVAQGLPAEVAVRVVRLGRARILFHAGRDAEALAAIVEARAPGAPPFVVVAAHALEVSVHVRAGELAAAESSLAAAASDPAGAERSDVAEAAVTVAIGRRDLVAAATLLRRLEQLDPFAAERASLGLAHALITAGQTRDARQRLGVLAGRYLRSVPSAETRRAAAAELARLGSP